MKNLSKVAFITFFGMASFSNAFAFENCYASGDATTDSEVLQNLSCAKKNGVDANAKDRNGYTKLMWAVENNYLETTKWIVENYGGINDQDVDGITPLMYAVYSGNLEVAEYLISQGADINAKDKDGWTALMWASDRGHSDVVKFLIQSGADVNIRDNNDKTALNIARSSEIQGNKTVEQYLRSVGAIE